jgi:hypothetical protein
LAPDGIHFIFEVSGNPLLQATIITSLGLLHFLLFWKWLCLIFVKLYCCGVSPLTFRGSDTSGGENYCSFVTFLVAFFRETSIAVIPSAATTPPQMTIEMSERDAPAVTIPAPTAIPPKPRE